MIGQLLLLLLLLLLPLHHFAPAVDLLLLLLLPPLHHFAPAVDLRWMLRLPLPTQHQVDDAVVGSDGRPSHANDGAIYHCLKRNDGCGTGSISRSSSCC